MIMVIAWVSYCLLLAAVLTAGAAVWEQAAGWSGRPSRWGWTAALGGSVLLPWLLRWVPAGRWPEPIPTVVPVLTLEPIFLQPAVVAPAGGWSVMHAALLAWLAVSALLAGCVAALVLRLRRARQDWTSVELEGGRVWVSRDVGPAALGVGRGAVVIPRWALDLGAELRSLLLLHEREHVRAGDPRLLLGATLLAAAMPWNPLVWLQLARLRNAIELDCDARVLGSGVSPRRYGALLIEVGRRRGANPLIMATFAEPRMFLESRIRRIARWPATRQPLRAVGLGTVALALFATALFARDPLRTGGAATAGAGAAMSAGSDTWTRLTVPPTEPTPATGAAPAVVPARADVPAAAIGASVLAAAAPAAADTPPDRSRLTPAGPTFTPMTERPELLNPSEVRQAMIRNYPPVLRDAGIGGETRLWFYIDDDGVVERLQVSRSSGHEALDAAALRVGSLMRFSPALNRDQRVAVWVELPVVFIGFHDDSPVIQRTEPRSPADVPAPLLMNRGQVQQAVARHYPPLLRDAGIGGQVTVALHVRIDGTVDRMAIRRSSGVELLDAAALSVAADMRFAPATRDGSPQPVWTEVPIVFSPH